MQNVNVKRDVLLETLIANREKHLAEYKDLYEQYCVFATKRLKNRLKEFKNRVPDTNLSFADADAPMSSIEEYDRAIAMLKMEQRDVLTLSSHEFNTYVLDNWSWKHEFNVLKMAYSSK